MLVRGIREESNHNPVAKHKHNGKRTARTESLPKQQQQRHQLQQQQNNELY